MEKPEYVGWQFLFCSLGLNEPPRLLSPISYVMLRPPLGLNEPPRLLRQESCCQTLFYSSQVATYPAKLPTCPCSMAPRCCSHCPGWIKGRTTDVTKESSYFPASVFVPGLWLGCLSQCQLVKSPCWYVGTVGRRCSSSMITSIAWIWERGHPDLPVLGLLLFSWSLSTRAKGPFAL